MFFCERIKKLQWIKVGCLDNYSSLMDEKSKKKIYRKSLLKSNHYQVQDLKKHFCACEFKLRKNLWQTLSRIYLVKGDLKNGLDLFFTKKNMINTVFYNQEIKMFYLNFFSKYKNPNFLL